MSIYGTIVSLDDLEHEDGCNVYVETTPGVLELSGRECSCGTPNAPLLYRGSNILPADTDPRGGTLDVALIPSHITRDGRDDQPEDGRPWPFLRLSVNDAEVVLTRRHALLLHAALGDWIARQAGA